MNKYSIHMAGYGSTTIEADIYEVKDGSFYFKRFELDELNDHCINIVAIYPVNRTAITHIQLAR
jgi:hypothetical protein